MKICYLKDKSSVNDAMGLINALFGTASEIDSTTLERELSPILIQGEQVTTAFKIVRDLFVFTQYRLIMVDKQGVTGRKVDYHSIPCKSISQFAVETAGHFDMDAELKIWISSSTVPIKKKFRRGTNIVGIQQALATYILAVR